MHPLALPRQDRQLRHIYLLFVRVIPFDHLTTNRATVPSLVSGFSLFIGFPAVLIVLADRFTPRRYLKSTRFRFATRLSPLVPRFPFPAVQIL